MVANHVVSLVFVLFCCDFRRLAPYWSMTTMLQCFFIFFLHFYCSLTFIVIMCFKERLHIVLSSLLSQSSLSFDCCSSIVFDNCLPFDLSNFFPFCAIRLFYDKRQIRTFVSNLFLLVAVYSRFRPILKSCHTLD